MPKLPLSGLCDAGQSLLVVVDMQQKLLAAMDHAANTEKNCSILLQASAVLEIPVMVSEQYPKGLGATTQSLRQQLTPATPIMEKTCFSCTRKQSISDAIGQCNRKQIILCGIEAHVCVLQTALELIQKDYQVFVASDAVSSRSGQNKENALQRLRTAGVIISNTESVLFEWLRDAAHPQFKAISALIR